MFPLAEGEEFARLVDSIRNDGLIDEIVLSHDQTTIIDGRNRYRACYEAMVDPVYIALGSHYGERDVVEYIISKNLLRRQIDAGQCEEIENRLREMMAEAVS